MTSDNNGGVRLQSVLDMPKVVRDLLWTVTSPHILSDAHYPVLPPEFGVDALEFVVVVEWFNGLAADPSPLVTFLQDMTKANGRSLALGVYFSALLEFWLRFCPHFNVERMDLGKQIVSSANRTMGQLKFLFRCNFPLRSESEEIRRQQRDFHVESSIKFFLLNPVDSKSTNGSLTANGSRQGAGDVENYDCIPLEQFVGPHLGENLAWRVQEVNRKLAASRGESVRAWLRENYSEHVQSHIVLRGYLFSPLHQFTATSQATMAHGWRYHPNPSMFEANRSTRANVGTSPNPSIASDHLRGWWTTDLETELPAKVRASNQEQLVVMDEKSGQVVVKGDEALDATLVESLSLEELVTFVQGHFQTLANPAKTNKCGGVAMPLLVSEIVRHSPELGFGECNEVYWYELSRGFILDPKCWDPSPLCQEPARFRRTLRGNVEREYETRHPGSVSEGFIKPDLDELAISVKKKLHIFDDPENVGPHELCCELAPLLTSENMGFSHADLKRATREFFIRKTQRPAAHDGNADTTTKDCFTDTESAYLRSCFNILILSEMETRLARRVGYLLLDVYEELSQGSNAELTVKDTPLNISAWVEFLFEIADDSARWDFLTLVLRAVELVLRLGGKKKRGFVDKQRLVVFMDKLLAARSSRWNAVVVETIRVFRMDSVVANTVGLYSTEDAQDVHDAFNIFAEQHDWQNAERLAILLQDPRIFEILHQHLSLLNMTKALKRLRKNAAGMQELTSGSCLKVIVGGGEPDHFTTHCRGNLIDHAKNLSMNKDSTPEFKWQYIDSPDGIEELVRRLRQHEASLRTEERLDERTLVRNILIGIDCEWRPQFLTKEGVAALNREERNTDSEDTDSGMDEGLSVYQLMVGEVVHVIDVQVLGEAAAAPLEFIWRPSSCLVLIGFCVSSDIQKIKESFSDLVAETTHRTTPLLLELKKLALFRHLPAMHWGLSRLCRECFGECVDKDQQCSDWGTRPLSRSQLVYAATDAYVVQRLAWHLLTDVSISHSEDKKNSVVKCAMEYLKRFDAATSHCSLPQTVESSDQPLGKQHVKAALQALGVTARFLKCGDSFEEKDGLIVKSIALVIRDRKQAEAPKRVRYAVAVLAVDRSIDMSALGVLMTADPADISLADKQTLVRVFGYSRGCLGPIGLRKQQATRVIVDACLKSESYLLCGAGATDEVYAITPSTLIGAVGASVGPIS